MTIRRQILAACAALLLAPCPAAAADYHVGPGQAYTSIGAVPWYTLQGGDTVYIHHRSTPYYEKFLISGRGTASQWIRVLGVPGPNGELPVISGKNATTSSNMRYRWSAASGSSAIQHLGLLQIAAGPSGTLPGYIEIANLQLQDAYPTSQFTAENGQSASFSGFAACIYARSVQHLIVRDSILTGCGQGFYNWTGSGNDWWDGLAVDIVLRGNYFYNNGYATSWTEHQVYTEADGVLIEANRFGPNRSNAWGSQIKDRSAGTVIRYNYIENASNDGWMIDLVEPENGFDALGTKASYRQAFIYGNVLLNRGPGGSNFVHWNEDHQQGVGRATLAGAKLFFYANTVVSVGNASDTDDIHLFNTTWGAYECPPGAPPGTIDVRNNIFAMIPRTAGGGTPQLRLAYCSSTNVALGRNWISPGWVAGTSGTVTGTNLMVSPSDNNAGFVNAGGGDFHLVSGSSAIGLASALAPEVTANSLGLDLTPTRQYRHHQATEPRSSAAPGSAVGAFGAGAATPPAPPAAPSNLRIES